MSDGAKPLRILIPVLGFGRAGGYRVLSMLATEWTRAGHAVSFLAPVAGPPPYFPTDGQLLWSDSKGPVQDAPQPGRRESGLHNVRALRNGISRIGNHFDVVLANHSFTAWAIALARLKSARLFYYVQADEAEYYLQERAFAGWAVARSSYALPLTQISNAAIYPHARPVAIVPPGIDLKLFSAAGRVRPAFRDPHRIVVGCIGRREPSKGIGYALEAFERIAAADPRFHLKVAYGNLPAGWSHPRAEVVMPGNDAELADFYRSLDLLVAPGTVQHGAPHYPVMEAMACGTAVVTTGYLPAEENNAWIVRNRDSAHIAETILGLVDAPDRDMRIATAQRAIRSFGWPEIADRMLQVFIGTAPASQPRARDIESQAA